MKQPLHNGLLSLMPPVNNKREERRMNENKARGESKERKHNKREEFQTEEWKRGMRERNERIDEMLNE